MKMVKNLFLGLGLIASGSLLAGTCDDLRQSYVVANQSYLIALREFKEAAGFNAVIDVDPNLEESARINLRLAEASLNDIATRYKAECNN